MVYTAPVKRFLAGFATATVLWGAAAAVLFLRENGPETADEPEPVAAAAEAEGDTPPRRGRASRRRRGPRRAGGRPVPTGTATTGDDLGENDPRALDMGGQGGEEALPRATIETAFDAQFGRIRKCLVLAAGDEPVSGRLIFGLRIEGSGKVSRVNLSGPAAVTTGDSGDCLRAAARALSLPSFDGPAMVVRYPITLE